MRIVNPAGFCDHQVPVLSTIGRGPKGEKGDVGDPVYPTFPDEPWSIDTSYDKMTVVLHEGTSFTSKQDVPAGIDISDTDYWVETGNYNAQIEQFDEILPRYAFSSSLTIKDYIDRLTVRRVLEVNGDPDFYPYTRCVWENVDGLYAGSQAACITDDESTIFFVRPFADADQTTTKSSNLVTVDARSGDVIANTMLDVGHGRTLSIKGNLLLTNNQYAMEDNEWVCIDVSDVANPVIVSRGTFYGAHIFWTDDGAACYDYSNNSITLFDVTYVNGVPIDFVSVGSVQLASSVRGEEQSFQYYNGLIVVSSTQPDIITFVDATSGETVGTIQLRSSYSYLYTAECESAFIVNDHLYFTNNSAVPDSADGTAVKEMSVFRCDLLAQKSEYYDPWTDSHLQNNSAVVSVSGTKNLSSSVTANGTSTYPYRFAGDAFVGFVDKRFRKPTANGYTLLSINFTTASYPYCIVVNNSDFYVGLNGIAEKTTTGYIFASNSVVSINRLHVMSNRMHFGINQDWAVGICSSNNAFVRILNTEFEYSGELTRYDVLARVNGMMQVENNNVIDSARADNGYIFYNKKVGIPTTSVSNGLIYNNFVQLLTGVTGLNFGISNETNNAWISFLKRDGSMTRLFIDASNGIYYRSYPDASDLNSFTNLKHVAWS